MAPTTITNQVNDNVFVELITIVKSHLGHKQNSLSAIAVHMEAGRLNHLGNISTVLGRTSSFLTTGGKAYLVVDHTVHGSTGTETASLRHLEGFHDPALAGKCRVAMHHNRQHLIAL